MAPHEVERHPDRALAPKTTWRRGSEDKFGDRMLRDRSGEAPVSAASRDARSFTSLKASTPRTASMICSWRAAEKVGAVQTRNLSRRSFSVRRFRGEPFGEIVAAE